MATARSKQYTEACVYLLNKWFTVKALQLKLDCIDFNFILMCNYVGKIA